MSDSKRFWSSIPGLLTGTAGVVTAIVGLFTVLIQLEVIGDKKADNGGTDDTIPTTTMLTRPGATTVPGAGRTGPVPTFTVTPREVKLDTLGTRDATVTLRNDGSAALSVVAVEIEGASAEQFEISSQRCTGADVVPRATCPIEVGYRPSVRGEHTATLRIDVSGARSPGTVNLSGSRLL